jgi:hypothetical protein
LSDWSGERERDIYTKLELCNNGGERERKFEVTLRRRILLLL